MQTKRMMTADVKRRAFSNEARNVNPTISIPRQSSHRRMATVLPPAPDNPPSSEATTRGTDIDDIFQPDNHNNNNNNNNDDDNEPSDIPRLRAVHHKAGYRDGISDAKHTSSAVQEGFDDGYVLGAEVGWRVGLILGLLEGLVGSFFPASATTTDGHDDAKEETRQEKKRLESLLGDARRELSVERIFGRRKDLEPAIESEEVVLSRWMAVVQKEAVRWGILLGDVRLHRQPVT